MLLELFALSSQGEIKENIQTSNKIKYKIPVALPLQTYIEGAESSHPLLNGEVGITLGGIRRIQLRLRLRYTAAPLDVVKP